MPVLLPPEAAAGNAVTGISWEEAEHHLVKFSEGASASMGTNCGQAETSCVLESQSQNYLRRK